MDCGFSLRGRRILFESLVCLLYMYVHIPLLWSHDVMQVCRYKFNIYIDIEYPPYIHIFDSDEEGGA